MESIITSAKRIVKFEEANEKAQDNSLQERSADLEIIITDVK